MMRRIAIVVAIVLLGSVAIATFISHQSTTHKSGETLHVEESTPGEVKGGIIAYKEMSKQQQLVFNRAIQNDNGSESIPMEVDSEIWVENMGVEYQNTTYTVAVSTSE